MRERERESERVRVRASDVTRLPVQLWKYSCPITLQVGAKVLVKLPCEWERVCEREKEQERDRETEREKEREREKEKANDVTRLPVQV